ncbi:Uma2 family endonuclease [Microcoleus sp. LEGE 07076]|uniref:Uma2 family endonuclease n=1 Tax=Microcoleus sp. LEGE 07076 TaxID=915322 RepID=UPI00187FBBF7|nr:Uma2 family endonuclease [Microcoleus sp. LEGE 07076]
MTAQVLEEVVTLGEQRLILPGYYSWEQFEAIESLMANSCGLRITYLDGWIEFMTLGEAHESFKKAIAILLEAYFFAFGIEFFPVGSATRKDRAKDVSFEPDESYYIGSIKEHPDLAIEVTMTSGSTNKLAKYLRLRIPEVWFWENNQLAVYGMRENDYELISKSDLLPELDLELLVRCVLMPSRIEARQEFLKGIRPQ